MCATVFAPDDSFDESAMRLYLGRQVDARLGVYLGSGGNCSPEIDGPTQPACA
jgi:hypothetical protein